MLAAQEQFPIGRDDPRQEPGRGAPVRYPWFTCPPGGWWRLRDGLERQACWESWEANREGAGERRYAFLPDQEREGAYLCVRVS
jgi:hypothetical protein